MRPVPITSDTLSAAAADPASPAWDTIWLESCDQGTCDPESAVLLPWLATTCAAIDAADREKPLALAGFIAVDATEDDRAAYAADIAALRALAVAGLPAATSDAAFVYLQQAVLGFDGDEIWAKNLDRLNDGEAGVECPGCAAELLLDLQETEDSPVEPGLATPLARRLHDEAVTAGREEMATGLTYLFGRVTCPECDTSFTLKEAL
jgi:hypothetical protein